MVLEEILTAPAAAVQAYLFQMCFHCEAFPVKELPMLCCAAALPVGQRQWQLYSDNTVVMQWQSNTLIWQHQHFTAVLIISKLSAPAILQPSAQYTNSASRVSKQQERPTVLAIAGQVGQGGDSNTLTEHSNTSSVRNLVDQCLFPRLDS